MAWLWKEKLLRYALRYGLAQTGLLDDSAIDLDNLDISIGRQNVIELRDLGLNIARISKLAQLPPALKLETARVLLLKLTIPADFYQSSIVVEVEGVEIVAALHDDLHHNVPQKKQPSGRARSPETARTPQHRKTNRRIHSTSLHDPGGAALNVHIPNEEEVAKSFYWDQSEKERQQLEQEALAYGSGGSEESFTSQSSTSSQGDAGTGTAVGVPGMFTTFLQGIVERFQLLVKNVEVKIEAEVQGDSLQSMPVTLRLRVGSANVGSVDQAASEKKREISLSVISVDLLSQEDVIAELSSMPSRSSAADSRSACSSKSAASSTSLKQSAMSVHTTTKRSPTPDPKDGGTPITIQTRRESYDSEQSIELMMQSAMEPTLPPGSPASPLLFSMQASVASEGVDHDLAYASVGDLHDIQPGEDHFSYAHSKRQASVPSVDIWKSMTSEEELTGPKLISQPARNAIPRASSLPSSSPSPTRQKRVLAPYHRSFQDTESSPRLEDNAHVQRQQSAGPPPSVQHQASSDPAPLDRLIAEAPEELIDHKAAALERTHSHSPPLEPDTPPDFEGSMDDDMLQSQMFTSAQADSLYHDAFSAPPESPTRYMPGAWESELQSVPSIPSQNISSSEVQDQDGAQLDGAHPSTETASGNATPRAQTPIRQLSASKSAIRPAMSAVRELLHIDQVTLAIPSLQSTNGDETLPQTRDARSTSAARGDTPGAYSAYPGTSGSQWNGTESIQTNFSSVVWKSEDVARSTCASPSIDITVGFALAQVDISTSQLLYKLATKLTDAVQVQESSHQKPATKDMTESSLPVLSLHLQRLHICLTEQIDVHRSLEETPNSLRRGLVDFICCNLALTTGKVSTIRAGDVEILLGGQELLKFERSVNDMAQSVSPPDDAIAMDIIHQVTAASKGLITRIVVETAPVRLSLDLSVFDEAFNSFGGLSGILELGNSVFLDSSLSSPVATKPSKGVRFAGEKEPTKSTTEYKLDATIGGMEARLAGRSCAMVLRTSTLKAAYREGRNTGAGVHASISRVVLSGPHCESQSRDTPLMVDLAGIRVEYEPTPTDKDLERLISLLTPSRDQYDDHEDILIETLLRQRRKGAILRVSVGDVKSRLDNFDCISTLSQLGDDLAKLSAVAKYLPEDDKPGLLSLLVIKKAEARIPVNDRFGKLTCGLQDLHLAHVGLPALLSFSIEDVFAKQAGGPQLIRALLPLAGVDKLPVVMARTIGNEIEPTVKVKLFNVCFEYSVPVILALTNMDKPTTPEELVNDIAQSIADLAMQERPARLARSPDSDLSSTSGKKTNISLLIHDSAIGLTPQRLPSKALIILNNAHIATSVPPSDAMSAKLELRKAAIFITDHIQDDSNIGPTPSRSNTTLRLSNALTQIGYVSVGSIMSAVVEFRAQETGDAHATKTVEVEVKNELFLLETCADSTQTLFATLGALAPPTPPSKIPKYLTQPMPIEDMMASFSGEPVLKPVETLFDVEKHDPDDLGLSTFEDGHDLLLPYEMGSSFYAPIGDGLDTELYQDEADNSMDEYEGTAESVLEDDPFVDIMSPVGSRLSDAALMRDLAKQSRQAVDSTPVDLGLYEIEDLGYDALGSGQQALGGQHRFNAPFVGQRGRGTSKVQHDVPFRLRLRDFNLIWHLHDGYDWQRTRDGIVDAVEQVERRSEERKARRRQSRQVAEDDESVIGDFLFNSIYITVPDGLEAQDIRRQINRGIDQDISETESVPVSGISRPTTYSASGLPRHRQASRSRLKLGRSRSHKIAFELKQVSADVVVFPPGSGEVVSSVDLQVRDFEIFDKVPTSTWRKFLTHQHTSAASREMAKPMFHIQLDNVKTLESHSASEIVLHVTVLPLRLHVDQDALDFITRFFEFKDSEMVDQGEEPGEKPFLQRVEIDTVDLILDYKPKTVDYAGLRSGRTKEFMNFVTLEGCEIRLKHAIIYGLQGFDLLHDTLSGIWTPDVIANQLPGVLSGLAPVRNLVNLGVGVRDVVAIPIREYRKDGRLVRSIQKGAFQFGKTTAGELARLGAKLALGTQTMLSTAEGILAPDTIGRHRFPVLSSSPGSGTDDDDSGQQRAISAYANQPLGVLSGLRFARQYLEHDLLTAKDAFIAVQGEILESRGPGGVAGAVVKHAPTIVLRPLIGVTRATGTALLGVGNAVDRENPRRVDDKYKRR